VNKTRQEGFKIIDTNIYDAIIIGSGMGGLNSGIYLQSKNTNLRTIILEKNSYPGGYSSGFSNKGFYFDSGAESVLGYKESIINKTLNELDFDHTFHKIEPIEAYYHDNKIVRMFSDLDKFLEEIGTHYHDQVAGVRALVELSHKIRGELARSRLDSEKVSFGKIIRVIFRFPYLRKYARKNFKQLLEEFITDERLYDYFNLFCLWLGLKFEEVRAPIAAHILSSCFTEGLQYPEGGFGAFATKLADHYIAHGGTIQYKATVKRIIVKNRIAKGVELEDGTILKAKYVISNCDLHKTVLDYVGKQHFRKRYLNFIDRLRKSISGILLYLGVEDLDLTPYPPHFIIGKNTGIQANIRENEFDMEGLGVRIPSNANPASKDGKKDSLVVLGFAPYKWNNFWKMGKDGKRTKEYRRLKNEVTERIIAVVEKIIPGISKHIVLKRLATPFTFEKYNNSSEGAWYGPELNQKLPNFKTPIRNLFLAGSNVGGAGVSAAMASGLNTGKFVFKKLKRENKKES